MILNKMLFFFLYSISLQTPKVADVKKRIALSGFSEETGT